MKTSDVTIQYTKNKATTNTDCVMFINATSEQQWKMLTAINQALFRIRGFVDDYQPVVYVRPVGWRRFAIKYLRDKSIYKVIETVTKQIFDTCDEKSIVRLFKLYRLGVRV